MHIEWVWDTDRAPDPTHVGDFFVLALVVITVLFFLGAQVLVLLRRNTASVRARRLWSLELMLLGSVTHIIAEFVSNAHVGHFTWFDSVRTFHCTFWDFWMKYGLGFNMWQVAQAGRLFAWFVTLEMKTNTVPTLENNVLQIVGESDGETASTLGAQDSGVVMDDATSSDPTAQFINSARGGLRGTEDAVQSFGISGAGAEGAARSMPYIPRLCECTSLFAAIQWARTALYKRRFGILTLFICVGFGVPGLLLCVAVEVTHSIEYSDVYHWCVTHSEFVYATVGWLLECVTVLMILLLRMRKYNARDSTSYRATRDSTYIGLLFLVVLVIANRFEVSVTWWGRSLQTMLVIALYTFSYVRLTWGMFRDAYLYGWTKENPDTHEATLSDIECVLSGEEKEVTFATIMRTSKSRAQFIQLLRRLPLWVLPSTFSSGMGQDQLTAQFAARCLAKIKGDGSMYVEQPGARRLRALKTSTSHDFSVDDNELDGDSSAAANSVGSGYHPLQHNDPSNYQFSMHGSNGLMMDVPLHDPLSDSHVIGVIHNAQTSIVEVCPADVWNLYVVYSNYRQLVEEMRMDEAIIALREILTYHFRLAEPPVERMLISDPASVQRDASPSVSSKASTESSTNVIAQINKTQPRSEHARMIAAAATGVVYPPSNASQSTHTPSSLDAIASRSITISDEPELRVTQESGTTALLLDRKCQSTTRVFAQFFEINRPERAQSSVPYSVTGDTGEVLEHGGIHTLPLTNVHLRAAYVAAAQCHEDLDMNDPLHSVGWMCEFLLNDVWLPWCMCHIPNFYRAYKVERRNMAMFVAMDDGLASRPTRPLVTVV